jgi:ribosomal-protein-alanine N-acetyltransferase
MNHCGTQEIESERLLLRKFEENDADLMYKNWANDTELTQFLTWPAHENSDETRSLLKNWILSYDDPDTYRWCIVLKETGEPIGSIGVVSISPRVESVELGYCIGKEYWNKGLMTETLKEIVFYLFKYVDVNRIEAHIDPRNVGSGKVLEKSGLTYTGLRRQVAINNTGLCDIRTYEIIRQDYSSL